jgi:hypothetical protein
MQPASATFFAPRSRAPFRLIPRSASHDISEPHRNSGSTCNRLTSFSVAMAEHGPAIERDVRARRVRRVIPRIATDRTPGPHRVSAATTLCEVPAEARSVQT